MKVSFDHRQEKWIRMIVPASWFFFPFFRYHRSTICRNFCHFSRLEKHFHSLNCYFALVCQNDMYTVQAIARQIL